MTDRIEKLLPDENFFSYHSTRDSVAFRVAEWDRLIESSFNAGGKVIDLDKSKGIFMPTSMTVQERKAIMSMVL